MPKVCKQKQEKKTRIKRKERNINREKNMYMEIDFPCLFSCFFYIIFLWKISNNMKKKTQGKQKKIK